MSCWIAAFRTRHAQLLAADPPRLAQAGDQRPVDRGVVFGHGGFTGKQPSASSVMRASALESSGDSLGRFRGDAR